mmetsp:Transcript_18383/g.20434  ORF Transcript_18383/g.20434 Transcript_18383/m.20434 type:complete len:210 (-) Transcript_18383:40-669(-)
MSKRKVSTRSTRSSTSKPAKRQKIAKEGADDAKSGASNASVESAPEKPSMLDNIEAFKRETTEYSQKVRALADRMQKMKKEAQKTLLFFQDSTTFWREYTRFMETNRKVELDDLPTGCFSVADNNINLYLLYSEVISRGGFLRVNHVMAWNDVYHSVCDAVPHATYLTYEAQERLKDLYKYFLLAYECNQRLEHDAIALPHRATEDAST